MIPVLAKIPSGKVDPENICLAESAVDDWVQFPLQRFKGAKDNM